METVFAEVQKRTTDFVTAGKCSDVEQDLSLDTNLLPEFETKVIGKVRDVYICKDCLVLVTTNRQSAFDRILCSVPYKGKVNRFGEL
jgi:phosphoribosylaminoimidazole-succinocarboxamide synthase